MYRNIALIIRSIQPINPSISFVVKNAQDICPVKCQICINMPHLLHLEKTQSQKDPKKQMLAVMHAATPISSLPTPSFARVFVVVILLVAGALQQAGCLLLVGRIPGLLSLSSHALPRP